MNFHFFNDRVSSEVNEDIKEKNRQYFCGESLEDRCLFFMSTQYSLILPWTFLFILFSDPSFLEIRYLAKTPLKKVE